jgi:hypothetical protein
MATIKGKGVVWSTGGITYSAGITGSDFPQSVSVNRASDKAEVKDNQGVIRAVIFSGFKKTVSITCIPQAADISGAQTSLDGHMPQAGTLVTVVDDSGTIIDGSYNVISAKQSRTVDGVAIIDLELEGSDEGVDITTPVS